MFPFSTLLKCKQVFLARIIHLSDIKPEPLVITRTGEMKKKLTSFWELVWRSSDGWSSLYKYCTGNTLVTWVMMIMLIPIHGEGIMKLDHFRWFLHHEEIIQIIDATRFPTKDFLSIYLIQLLLRDRHMQIREG